MGIKIKSINESVKDQGLKALVHGLAGSGKTVMCATAGEKTLLISAEGGLLSIKGAVETGMLPESVYDLVDVVEVTSMEELLEVYNYATEPNDYSWVILDSISEIAETLLAEEKEHSKDPRQAYGNLITEMQALLRKFRDLPMKNVLFTAKQQRVTDEDTGRSMYVPSMPGSKLHQAIPYMFDEVFALRVEKDDDGEDYRILQTNRDTKYEAKDRSGKLELFEEPVLFSLMKKIRSGAIEDNSELEGEDRKKAIEEDAKELGITPEQMEEDIEEVQKSVDACAEESEQVEEVEEKESPQESEEIIAEKKMYWFHDPSDDVMETDEGDDISALVNDPDVHEITKLKYIKLKG